MSYLDLKMWEIIPETSPRIIKNCSKCGCKSHYINTGNFRVNANGNCIDVWLIYQCHKCKTTYNLTIYERIKPNKIPSAEYEKYLANDQNLAMQCGFNSELLKKNKVVVTYDDVNYQIITGNLKKVSNLRNEQIIVIRSIYELPQVKLNKILALQLGISRTKVKKLIEEGLIYSLNLEDITKSIIKDGMEIAINTTAIIE